MTVLEMLSEVIGSEELLGLVAFAEFVHVGEVVYPTIPVRLRVVRELLATVPAHVCEGAIGTLR